MHTKTKTNTGHTIKLEVHLTIDQQQQRHQPKLPGRGGLNAFNWRQIFNLDFVKTQHYSACMAAA